MSSFRKVMLQGFVLLLIVVGLFFFGLVAYRHNPESMTIPFFMGLDIIFMAIIIGMLIWLASSI